MPWHAMGADDVVGTLSSDPAGLTRAEAEARLARVGTNVIYRRAAVNDVGSWGTWIRT